MLISFDSFHQIKLYNFFRTTVVSTYPVCFIMQLRAQVNIRLICIFQVSIDQQTVYCPLKLIIKILILSFFIPLYCIVFLESGNILETTAPSVGVNCVQVSINTDVFPVSYMLSVKDCEESLQPLCLRGMYFCY